MSGENQQIDPDRIAELYKTHSEGLRAFLVGLLKNRELAEEILQTTFLRALESGHTARSASIKGWLFRVAHNEAMNIKRRGATGRKVMQRLADQPQSDAGLAETDGFTRLCQFETAERVRQALQMLPAEQRSIVEQRIYHQKTFAVIAGETGVPLGTLLTRMRLALQKLSQVLKEKE